MPAIHQIGPHYFVHKMSYPNTKFPLSEKGHTQEIEHPYRTGQSVVVRVPFTRRALVIGKWTGEKYEEDALTGAIGLRELGPHVSS